LKTFFKNFQAPGNYLVKQRVLTLHLANEPEKFISWGRNGIDRIDCRIVSMPEHGYSTPLSTGIQPMTGNTQFALAA
jgi:hypothetical protein